MEQPAAQDPLIGLTIGNYQIKNKLGEGGMGSVYLAEHPLIGKQVALKVLHAEFASNRDVVARFFTEAKSVNDIQHPNIVDIVDYGELHTDDGGNMVYFIMEFLDGDSLSNVIRREAPMAPERALAICLQIADALGASHQNGVVHRDLKPDNVILITRGRQSDFVKVLDFGIAKLTGDQPGSRRTRTGIVMGTPAYMSPEQCEGRGSVDHRTDIYALGILLYEMIVGRVPFLGEGYGEVLVQHLTQAPARPSTIRAVSPHVELVILKALEKNVDLRYPTMEEFMKALADPVGYVERNGGLNGFLQTQLHDTGGPVPTSTTPTPSPLTPLTPAPGTLSSVTPAGYSGAYQPTPAPGSLSVPTPFPAQKSKTPLIIGIVVALLAIGGGVAFMAMGGGDDKNKDDNTVEAANNPTDDEHATDDKPDLGTQPPVEDTPKPPVEDPKPPVEDKPVEPPKPVKVTLSVTTRPDGADVFVGDEKKPRGQTPIDIQFDKGEQAVDIRIERKRYKSETRSFTPKASKGFDIELSREHRSTSSSSHKTGKDGKSGKTGKDKPIGSGDKDGVVSPF